MRIALVILHADPARGGAEKYTEFIAELLRQRGHDVTLLASSFPTKYPEVEQVVLHSGGITRLSRYQYFLDALDDHLKTHSYDIVHAMLPVRQCDIYHPHAGIAAETSNGLKAFFNPRRAEMAKLERELLTRADPPTVLILSDYVKQFVTKHYPSFPDQKLKKLFNAVGLDYFDPQTRVAPALQPLWWEKEVGADDVVALIIAQDFERKGVLQAIAATKLVNANRSPGKPRLRLMVVGREHSAGADGDIIYVGESWRVVLFYLAADFFVLPTRHDPCSLVVLEALAMGLPVITTRQNGASEIMTDGKEGFILESRDDPLLAERMKRLLDGEVRRRMSEAALALRPRLSQEEHVNRLLEIYESTRAGSMRGASS